MLENEVNKNKLESFNFSENKFICFDVEDLSIEERQDLLDKRSVNFVDLVERTWFDFSERNLYKEFSQGREIFNIKKTEVINQLYGVDYSDYTTDEDLDSKIIHMLRTKGRIAYVPSIKACLWYAPKEIHENVLTVNHKGIISTKEQEVLKNDVSVVIGGVSVGASIVKSLAKLGVGNITGFDSKTIGVHHLSRMDTSPVNVGRSKAESIHEDIRMLNPYANWDIKDSLLDSRELDVNDVCKGNTPVKILIDAIDDPDEKLMMRKFAFKEKMIVIMATDIGNGRVMLDIDDFRFSNSRAFGGKLDLSRASLVTRWRRMEHGEKIMSIVGVKNLNKDMIDALPGIFRGEYASYPQLGLTSQIAGGVVSNTVLNLIRGIKLKPRSLVDINRVNNKKLDYLSREGFGKFISMVKAKNKSSK